VQRRPALRQGDPADPEVGLVERARQFRAVAEPVGEQPEREHHVGDEPVGRRQLGDDRRHGVDDRLLDRDAVLTDRALDGGELGEHPGVHLGVA
jgi:hypothetical protein